MIALLIYRRARLNYIYLIPIIQGIITFCWPLCGKKWAYCAITVNDKNPYFAVFTSLIKYSYIFSLVLFLEPREGDVAQFILIWFLR